MSAAHLVSSATANLRERRSAFVWLFLLCLPALVPLIVIAAAVLSPEAEVWSHLAQHVLPRVIANTVKLVIGVAVLAGALGTLLAWLTALCEFPGRRFFDAVLLLPLAFPAYVLAFVAVGFLDYAGPLQTWLRDSFGSSQWFPPIRSTGGAILVLSLATYPYVYLLARSAFLTQGRRALEAAQTLGLRREKAAWRVALPMARPWIAAGVALVVMETLADFGAVSVFNYDTFTTAIYRAWSGLFSLGAALELAGVLLIFVAIVLVFERRSRASARYAAARDASRSSPRLVLGPVAGCLASLVCSVVFLIAFALPLLQLISWSATHALQDLDSRYLGFLLRSLLLSASAATIIVAASVFLAYTSRRLPTPTTRGMVRIATIGYSIPGTVLAIGILVPLALLNNSVLALLRTMPAFEHSTLLLHGTLIAVLFAYMARFLAVGFGPIESGLHRVTHTLDEAAIGLGVTGRGLLRKVHLPLLRTSLATAATLVFVDVMKEMPITLITRPPGWDTLAVRVWEMTSEGEWERAALPAIAIVLAGLIPAVMLTRRETHVA